MDATAWIVEIGVFIVGMVAGVCLWEVERDIDEEDPPIIETAWGKVR